MERNSIRAIVFDMGGTLRRRLPPVEGKRREMIGQILDCIRADLPVEPFTEILDSRAHAYRKWAQRTRTELDEASLWAEWLLPDFPEAMVRQNALHLNRLYNASLGEWEIFPDAREVVLELHRRGYRLGLVSNTTSSVESLAVLDSLNVQTCFSVVLLSAVTGKRKPDPAMLLKAAAQLELEPRQCAYVGDRPSRDVAAARGAGYQCGILIETAENHERIEKEIQLDPTTAPDYRVHSLTGLLRIFQV